MTAGAIAATALRRYLRDRTALFFVAVLPILVIVLVGSTVRGFDSFRIGVVATVDGPISAELVAALERSPALAVERFTDVVDASTAARRGEVAVAVVVPAGLDAALAEGRSQTVEVLGDLTDNNQRAAWSAVASVVAGEAGRVQAARFAVDRAGATLEGALDLVVVAEQQAPPIGIEDRVVDGDRSTLPEGFSYSAPTMLVLFVFINALAGGAGVIESRRLGIYARAAAAPVLARSIVAGETLCYLALALLQSVLIVSVGAVVFGVDWGDPLAAAALVAVWALVGTGAGVLSGTVFRTPEQASSIGPSVGIALGMLGGCMWPLEIVPPVMRTVGHLVPHGWAVDAWTALLSRGADLGGIAVELGALAGFAVGLLSLATLRLRRVVAP